MNGEKWNRFILQTKKDKKWYWKPASWDDWPFCHNVLPRVCVSLKRLVNIWSLWCFIGTYLFSIMLQESAYGRLISLFSQEWYLLGMFLGNLYNITDQGINTLLEAELSRNVRLYDPNKYYSRSKCFLWIVQKQIIQKWNYQSKNRHT